MKTANENALKKNILFRLAIFLAPFFALSFFTLLFGYAPLGNTPAQAAGDTQYLAFLSSLHSALRGKGFFAFTDLASNASYLYARYAGSPFTWLLALLPTALHASTAFLILALKSGLAALACSFYLSRRRKTLPPAFLFILSFSYALPACLSLTDGMALFAEQLILLPLLLLSLESFLEKGKTALLIFSLTFILLTGYGIFYTTLLVAALALLLSCIEGRLDGARIKSALPRLIFACAISVLLALPLLIHAFGNLRAVGTVASYSGSFFYRLPLLLLTFLGGVTIPEFPAFYIGLLPLLTLPLFFTSRAFSRRYRISVAITLALLCLFFFFVNPFGGALAFALSFFVLLASADFLSAHTEGHKKTLTVTALVLLFLPVILQKLAYRVPTSEGDTEILSSLFGVYIPLTVILLSSILLSSLIAQKKPARVLSALFIILFLLDGFATTFSRTSGKTFLETESVAQEDAGDMTELLLSRADVTLSPTERTRLYITGNARLPYASAYLLEQENASSLSPALARTLAMLGYDMRATHDTAPFRLGDFFLGVSHYVSDAPLSSTDYTSLKKIENYTLYRASALPIVFTSAATALNFSFEGNSPFLYTNAFTSALLGQEAIVYRPLSDVTVTEKENGVTLTGTAKTAGTLCYYSDKVGSRNLNITANGYTVRPYENGAADGMILFGNMSNDSTVTAVFNTPHPVSAELFRVADEQELSNALSTLGTRGLRDAALNGNRLTGKITTNDSAPVLMTTLPYDGGYTVTLDGKTLQGVEIEGFLAVLVSEAGTHTVSIERNASFGIDLLPTAIGLLGTASALALLLLKNKKEKSENTK